MLSWQAMLLNGFLRLTMKRHGKQSLDLRRLRAMTKNPPRSALTVPAGYTVESLPNPIPETKYPPLFAALLALFVLKPMRVKHFAKSRIDFPSSAPSVAGPRSTTNCVSRR